MSTRPILSIGLPVLNGEAYLREALDSLLSQSLTDIELVISDNASSDGTRDICAEYARRDPRIRYFRQDSNRGAAANFNFVFEQARGRYFKWAAHDDTLDPECMAACVAVLEEQSDVVLCHPLLIDVDSDRNKLWEFDRGEAGKGPPHERFWHMILGGHNCAEIFGVIRSAALEKTRLMRNYTDSDRTLLGELAILGRFHQVPGVHFYRRIHPEKSDRVFPVYARRAEWFDPGNRGRLVMSAWRQLGNWFVAVMRSDLPVREKGRYLFRLAKATKWRWKLYARELRSAMLRRSQGQPGQVDDGARSGS